MVKIENEISTTKCLNQNDLKQINHFIMSFIYVFVSGAVSFFNLGLLFKNFIIIQKQIELYEIPDPVR